MDKIKKLLYSTEAMSNGEYFRIPAHNGSPAIPLKEVAWRKGYYLFSDKDGNYYLTDNKFNCIVTFLLDKYRANKAKDILEQICNNVDTDKTYEEILVYIEDERFKTFQALGTVFYTYKGDIIIKTDENKLPVISKEDVVLFKFSDFINEKDTNRFYEPYFDDFSKLERYDKGVIKQRIGNKVVNTTIKTRARKRNKILNKEVELPYNTIIIGDDVFTEHFITNDLNFVPSKSCATCKNGNIPSIQLLGTYLGTPVYKSELLCNGYIPEPKNKKFSLEVDNDLWSLQEIIFLLGEVMLLEDNFNKLRVNFQLDSYNKILFIKRIKEVE